MRYLIILVLIPFVTLSQPCEDRPAEEIDFKSITQFAPYEIGWYHEWLEYTSGEKVYPDGITVHEKWDHPFMKFGYTSAMHEDAHASDVSNLPGPLMEGVEVQYFHVLEKGGSFSGMCPTFTFINDSTVVTLSFGRANTTLLILDITDTIKVLDHIVVPGRGSTALELATKKGRSKIFSNTAGGAYSYLSGKDRIYIPGANSNILRIRIIGRSFDKQHLQSVNLKDQIEAGNLVDKHLSKKDKLNTLTALIPDVNGNIWFTSRQGVVGLIHRQDTLDDGCPIVYASFIGFFGAFEKIQRYANVEIDSMEQIESLRHIDEFSTELRKEFREELMMDKDTREEIQNSFSVGKNGVYIVSNMALYKLYFNEESKSIELDPKWTETWEEGDLVYDNDRIIKPGHLNEGSGTTPTLMDDRFVIICDNDTNQVNLCVYSQETGKLVSKLPLFSDDRSAVENSVVAYTNSLIVANTYGYTDPFKENNTPGGIMRFDWNPDRNTFEKTDNWPASGLYDCKTATPKLSAPNGMLYVYNRSDEDVNGHHGWQITTIDYRTGLRVFYIKPWFEKGEFDDNVGFIMRGGALGNKNYDLKVFNNIWGTFTFGPGNSFYIGAYRGFIRISSQ